MQSILLRLCFISTISTLFQQDTAAGAASPVLSQKTYFRWRALLCVCVCVFQAATTYMKHALGERCFKFKFPTPRQVVDGLEVRLGLGFYTDIEPGDLRIMFFY